MTKKPPMPPPNEATDYFAMRRCDGKVEFAFSENPERIYSFEPLHAVELAIALLQHAHDVVADALEKKGEE